ncbi:hypothetical protein [uncultured Rikenella sp.]|uniref:hypothetical protein n=1 Tax=uncultured Rikenella sp. TaxID=368003 RepID=UPI00272CB55D|nr:hypothetical protein [uncultured Rikenella sp.]
MSRTIPIFPAPGFRSSNTGVPGGIGNNGYNWSSSVVDSYGCYLRFVMNAVQPSYPNGRANGLQLRCLSE